MVNLQAQDGLDANLLTGSDKLDRAGQQIVIRESNGRHAIRPCRLRQIGWGH